MMLGCSTTVPLRQKFPTPPSELLTPVEDLTPPDPNKRTLTDMLQNVNVNYGKYYDLQDRCKIWNEWYNENKKIFDQVKE